MSGQGHYEQKHAGCWLLRWSHGARLQRAVDRVMEAGVERILDYGCGDGLLLIRLREAGWNGHYVGTDVDEGQLAECRRRLGVDQGADFLSIEELRGTFPLVLCLEVLEHVIDLEETLERLDRHLSDGGELVISVPVETGWVLPMKQVMRRCIGWWQRNDYRYVEAYSAAEMIRALIPWEGQLPRPIYGEDPGPCWHGHKNFNWRHLRQRLRGKFRVIDLGATPSWLMASQRWLACDHRDS